MSEEQLKEYEREAITSWVADSADTIEEQSGSASRVFGKANLIYKTYNVVNDIIEIRENPDYPENVKDVMSAVAIAYNLGGPFILAADVPFTFEQAWALLNNVPENMGGMTKQEFYEQLSRMFPDLVDIGPDGKLSPVDFSDWQDFPSKDGGLNSPLHPGNREPSPFPDDVQAPFTSGESAGSPLVIDVDGDGIELAALSGPGSVYWDIDQDGFREASGWIAGGDGLLALDRNGSGEIDAQNELFGTLDTDGFTVLRPLDTNGFAALNAQRNLRYEKQTLVILKN